jgi:pyruvate kinase
MDQRQMIAAENTVIANRIVGTTDEQTTSELEAIGLSPEEAAAVIARLDADAAAQRTIAVARARQAMADDDASSAAGGQTGEPRSADPLAWCA